MSLRTRIRILARDDHRCVYCGRSSRETVLEVDHKVPRSKGGTNNDLNLVTACRDCNAGKSDMLLTPAYMTNGCAHSDINYTGRDARDGVHDERYLCRTCGELGIPGHYLAP